MNGHFEIDNTAYPIGYLTGANGYRVTDMRSLQVLHSHHISKEQAVRIASETNHKLRAGALSLKEGDTSVADFVLAEVEKL